MALLFALALFVPLLRNFYELSTPTAEAIVAWGIGVAVGVGGMVVALPLFMRGDFDALAEARSAPNQPVDQ